jgi:hypothetical protein
MPFVFSTVVGEDFTFVAATVVDDEEEDKSPDGLLLPLSVFSFATIGMLPFSSFSFTTTGLLLPFSVFSLRTRSDSTIAYCVLWGSWEREN